LPLFVEYLKTTVSTIGLSCYSERKVKGLKDPASQIR